MINSIYDLFLNNSYEYKNEDSIFFKNQNSLTYLSWANLKKKCDIISNGINMLGAQEKTRISIISSTNLYWILIDLSIAKLKSITVPIHINTSKKDMLHIINNSNIQFIFIENKIDLEKIRKIKKNTINLKKIIFFYNNKFTERLKNEITLNQLISLGLNHQSESKSNFNKKNVILKNNIASIVYTSGTTGKSKGAIITHFNLIHTAKAIKKINFIKKNDIQLLFLPLSHIFAKILMIVWLTTNHKLCMVRNINKIINEMPKLKPTIMAAVPRIFEKIHYKIIDNMFSGTFIHKKISQFIINEFKLTIKNIKKNKKTYSISWFLIKKFIFSKIAKKLNKKFGSNLRMFISGSAPLSYELNYFFKYLKINIYEGYGLTETTAAAALNHPKSLKIGSVGKGMPDTKIKIAKDGEILVKNSGIFLGYWNNQMDTKKSINKNGYFKTGDLGFLSSNKFLTITGRKKDIIITATGKNIPPQKIEFILKNESSIINQAIVYGDKKKFISALIFINNEEILKKNINLNIVDLRKKINKIVNRANSVLSKFEQIKKFEISYDVLKIGIELTPTLKIKRSYLYNKYKKIFKSFYKN